MLPVFRINPMLLYILNCWDFYRLIVLIAAFGVRCVVGVDGWLAIMAPWNPRMHVDHD